MTYWGGGDGLLAGLVLLEMSGSDGFVRKATRGIGGLALFFIVCGLAASVTDAIVILGFGRSFFRSVPLEAFPVDILLQLFAAILAGYFGVVLGASVLDAAMKNYPARGIGVAFVILLVTNYLLHFLFFANYHFIPDVEIYSGLLQSIVAIVTTWCTFRLPPFGQKSQANFNLTRPQKVPKLFLLFFIVLNFGWPLRWGLLALDIRAPLIWSIAMAAFVLTTGWRLPNKGATALNLYRSGSEGPRREQFAQIQIFVRMVVLDWMKERKVVPLLAKSFEDTLYERFKPRL